MSQTMSPPASALPPGPWAPAWWQLVRFAGNGRFVMLSDLEAVREVFRGDPDVLHSGEANSLFTATVGRHSVLVLDGAPHARQRRVVVPPLKGERMRAFFDAMRIETLEAVRAWPVGAPFPTLPTMRRVTLRVILRTGLGLAPGPEMDRFEQKMERFLSNGRQRYALVLMTVIPIRLLSGSRWAPLFRQLRDLEDALCASSGAGGGGHPPRPGKTVLDDLLAAAHEDGTPLGDREVRDALLTILIAGHDTTALALARALGGIAEHPAVVNRLHDELARVTGGGP